MSVHKYVYVKFSKTLGSSAFIHQSSAQDQVFLENFPDLFPQVGAPLFVDFAFLCIRHTYGILCVLISIAFHVPLCSHHIFSFRSKFNSFVGPKT